MRFLSYIYSYSSGNEKSKELGRWVIAYKLTLFNTEEDFRTFLRIVKEKVAELNKTYPRTIPFVVNDFGLNDDCYRIEVYVDGQNEKKTVLYMTFDSVRHIFSL